MGLYKVKSHPQGIEVSQIEVFPLCLGLIAMLGVLALVYVGSSDLRILNSWITWCFIAFFSLMGAYLILFKPCFKRVLLLKGAEQLESLEWGIIRKRNRRYRHQGLKTLKVTEEDSDSGKWYVPIIALENGKFFKVGFGCSTYDLAQLVIEQLVNASDTQYKTP